MPPSHIESQDSYTLYCHGRLTDPYPFFDQLRSTDPVHWCQPLGAWLVTRYGDVASGHLDNRLSSDKAQIKFKTLMHSQQQKLKALGEHLGLWVSHTDPPTHTRLRNLVNFAFTPRISNDMRPDIEQMVNGLIDGAARQGRMDVMSDVANPLPIRVICHMLGIAEQELHQFERWIEDVVAFIDGPETQLSKFADQACHSLLELTNYVNGVVNDRRHQPRQDLISALVGAEQQGDKLNSEELLAMCVQMLVGGHDTTSALIGSGIYLLLKNPEQLARVRGEPKLMASAVEEFLRYETPGPRNSRLATQDMELGGQPIKRGQTVQLLLGAANRDPQQFPDPHRLEVGRKPNRHLAFGWGPHFCVGAPLARVMAQTTIGVLLRRLTGLRLDDGATAGPLPWRQTLGLRSLERLPIRFE